MDLAGCFLGTLNLDIGPLVFELVKPEFTFRAVNWTDLHPPETFSFSRCRIAHAGEELEGWIYYPHPETKERHFQDPSLMEIIAPFMTGLTVGDELQIRVDPVRVSLKPCADHRLLKR